MSDNALPYLKVSLRLAFKMAQNKILYMHDTLNEENL